MIVMECASILCEDDMFASYDWGDALFKRAPEGWTFHSPYPRIFSRRHWTYLLTDVEKERLAKRLRRGLRTLQVLAVGVCVLAGGSLAFSLPDLLRQLVAGSLGAWLLFSLVSLVLVGVLVPAIFIAHYRLVQPVLSAARRIGPAPLDRVSGIRLLAEMKSARALILRGVLALLASGLGAYLSLTSSRDADLLLILTVFIGMAAVWHAALLVVKLRAQRGAHQQFIRQVDRNVR